MQCTRCGAKCDKSMHRFVEAQCLRVVVSDTSEAGGKFTFTAARVRISYLVRRVAGDNIRRKLQSLGGRR